MTTAMANTNTTHNPAITRQDIVNELLILAQASEITRDYDIACVLYTLLAACASPQPIQDAFADYIGLWVEQMDMTKTVFAA